MGLVEDGEARMALAHQHKCHDLVINVSTVGEGPRARRTAGRIT